MTLLIKNMNMKRGKNVIRQLNLLVESGEVAALIALNGFGKTTFAEWHCPTAANNL